MDWEWDETLFRGAAQYYTRGRLPYPAGLADAFAAALELDGRGRLIDVGCGPGTIALQFAHLFEEVVGVDPDADMLAEASRLAAEAGIDNTRWVKARGEELSIELGGFRIAAFSRSFHWMDRDRVAAIVRKMLESGGAFVQISDTDGRGEPGAPLPHPEPPRVRDAWHGETIPASREHEAITSVVQHYLGTERRAGQGVRNSSPGDENAVLVRNGFEPARIVKVAGGEVIVRTIDDVMAHYYSASGTAPHLFGARLADFDADARAVLVDASPSGLFAERTRDTEVRIWRRG